MDALQNCKIAHLCEPRPTGLLVFLAQLDKLAQLDSIEKLDKDAELQDGDKRLQDGDKRLQDAALQDAELQKQLLILNRQPIDR